MSALRYLLGVVVTLTALAAGAQDKTQTQHTVRGLKQQGWAVTGSVSRNETRPGLPPYEHLPRVVSVTTYTLTRDGKTMRCEIAYDSQRDTLQEQCGDSD